MWSLGRAFLLLLSALCRRLSVCVSLSRALLLSLPLPALITLLHICAPLPPPYVLLIALPRVLIRRRARYHRFSIRWDWDALYSSVRCVLWSWG
ncbi:hypothetical protein PLICRDRAFT_341062 [Plicaturopsis crispa FD-325 SS-3]|uniref:Uncharacterized protein n=1 Tax=Plicaturopsis crispa FD-325 SS-3 TaxID=944288 RepID=A0A0C9T965_PLICR|nr:hypothetical protein PLICRDRAFT_341062 [Plicaturopsis crispa FD-325 SS-3]